MANHTITMQAKVLCVYDEGAKVDTPLIGARGQAILIDVDGQRTLFDTGMRAGYLAHNLSTLEVDPESIDRVAVSHGAKDHVCGIGGLLKGRETPVEIVAPTSAMGKKKLMGKTGLFISETSFEKAKIRNVDDWEQLSEHLFMTPPVSYKNGEESFLVLRTKFGTAVISGASNCGVQTVLDMVKDKFGVFPKIYIGGVRLGKKDKKGAEEIADAFSKAGCTDLRLNHCTTPDGITALRVKLGLHGVENFYVGYMAEYEV